MGWVAAALAVISGGISYAAGNEAKKDARKYATNEARLEGIVTNAKIRDLEVKERVMRGETIGRAAGSGVSAQHGSPLQLLAEQAREFGRERRTVAEAGATRAAAAKTRGEMVGRQAQYRGVSSAVSSLSSAFSMFAK